MLSDPPHLRLHQLSKIVTDYRLMRDAMSIKPVPSFCRELTPKPFSSQHLSTSSTLWNLRFRTFKNETFLRIRLEKLDSLTKDTSAEVVFAIALLKNSELSPMDGTMPTARDTSLAGICTDWYTDLIQLIGNQKITQRVPWVRRPVPTAPDDNC